MTHPLLKQFHETLKKVENEIGSTGETDNIQLDKFGKKHFGKKWGGCYPEDEKVNFNDEKEYYIFNNEKKNKQGCHWLGVYVNHKNRVIFVLDTFDRQSSHLLPDVIIEAKKDHFKCKKGALHKLQLDIQEDCGSRSLTWLSLVKKYGIDTVKQYI